MSYEEDREPGGVRTREMVRQEQAKAERESALHKAAKAYYTAHPPQYTVSETGEVVHISELEPWEPGYVPAKGLIPEDLLTYYRTHGHPGAAQIYVGEETEKRKKELKYQYEKERLERHFSNKSDGWYRVGDKVVVVVDGKVKIYSTAQFSNLTTGKTLDELYDLKLISHSDYLSRKQAGAFAFRLQYAEWEKATYPKLTEFQGLWNLGKYEEALAFGYREGLISSDVYKIYSADIERYKKLQELFGKMEVLGFDIAGLSEKMCGLGTGIYGLKTEVAKRLFEIEVLRKYPGWKVAEWKPLIFHGARAIGYTPKLEEYMPTKPVFAQVQEFFYGGGLEKSIISWIDDILVSIGAISKAKATELKAGYKHPRVGIEYIGVPVGFVHFPEPLISAVWLGEATIGRVEEAMGAVGVPVQRKEMATWGQLALTYGLIIGTTVGAYALAKYGFPIKYGKVTYPTPEGEKVAYRGIYAQWKEKAHPLLGRTEGAWALGTPEVSFAGISLEKGWAPVTPLETKIVTQNLAALGYSPEEIQKILLTWKLGIAVKGLPPPYMQEKILAAEHFADPERAREVFLQWAKDWRSQLQQVYGSATAYAQMPPEALAERGVPIHDYDVMMKAAEKSVSDLLSRLTRAGETVWISPERPTLIETPMGHAVDIHTYLEAMGYKVPEGAWGITFQQPPVKIGEIEAMRLGEFATRKMGSILTLRPEGAYPEAYRMKDITDFFISAKYLLGGVKTETLTQLQTLWGVSAEEMAKATISLPPYHYAAPPSISMPYAPIVISSLVVPSFISKPISPLVSAKLPSILSIPYTPVSPISERSLSQYYSQMYRPMASVLSYPTVSKISYPPIPSYAKPSPPSISYPIKKYKIPSYPIPSIPSYPYRPSIPSYPPYSPPPYTPPSYPPYSPPTYTPPYYPPYTPPHPGLKIEEVGYPRFKWFERLHPIFEPHEVARMMGVRIPKVKVSPQLKHAEGIARLIGTVPRQKVRPRNVMFGKKPQRRYPIKKRKRRKKHKRGRLNRGIQQLM